MTNKVNKIIIGAMLVAVIIGFFDSSYLFYKYLTASPIDCLLFDGCNTVAKSPYSHVFGMPLPVFGIAFYSLMLISVLLFTYRETIFLSRIVMVLGAVGFIFSMYFIYLQGFVIQAFCIYCLLSALTSTILFCLSIFAYHAVNSANNPEITGI